jgi:hypothetical protein
MKELKRFKEMKFSKENVEKAERIVKQIKSGRPPKYDTELHPVMLFLIFLEGKDIEAFCFSAEIHRAQFFKWVHSYPEFGEAYEHGLEVSRLWWMERAQRGIDDTSFNNTLWSMVMRNRFRFTEHRAVEVPGLNLSNRLNPTESSIRSKEKAIAEAISNGTLTGSEITYLTNYLNSCIKIDEVEDLTKRLEMLEDKANG